MEVIKLNVGGVKYETTKQTLMKYGDSMLAKMFGGSLPIHNDKDGYYFIDSDGEMFKYILEFLRKGQLLIPDDFKEFDRLKAEVDFYSLNIPINNLTNYNCVKRILLLTGINIKEEQFFYSYAYDGKKYYKRATGHVYLGGENMRPPADFAHTVRDISTVSEIVLFLTKENIFTEDDEIFSRLLVLNVFERKY